MVKTIEISDELYDYLREKGKTGDTFTKVIEELIRKPDIQEKSFKKITSNNTQALIIEPLSDNIKQYEPIMQITNRETTRRPPNGTRIRFRFRGQNYETQINTLRYKYPTLNSIFINEFNANVNIWRHVKDIYFKDENGWQPLTFLRG